MASEADIALAVQAIERISAAMRKGHVLRATVGDVTLELDSGYDAGKVTRNRKGPVPESSALDEDQILFAASEGYDLP